MPRSRPAPGVEPPEVAALRGLLLADDRDGGSPPPGPVPAATVTAVLVAHDGDRWLPRALAALAAQARRPDVVVAVDTGSADATPGLLASACRDGVVSAVIRLDRTTGFGSAVRAGLAAGPRQSERAGPAYAWLLHDDCAPEPQALAELLRAAAATPRAAVLGPKIRGWDDPRRLLEAGVTVDRAGRRVTGLEPGELDQGQRDGQRQALAVGTAGALVAVRRFEEMGGLDPALPLFGDDVDLGWRTWRAGQQVLVVPRAVVRHAAAVSSGLRPADAAGGRARGVERRHDLWLLAANTPGSRLLLLLPRLVLAAALRGAWLLATRRPRPAAGEVAALAALIASPRRLAAARAWRRGQPHPVAAAGAARALLAPRGGTLRAAAAAVAGWVATGGGPPPGSRGVEPGPVDAGEEDLPGEDARGLRGALTRPGAVLTVALTLVALLAGRRLLGAGVLAGGRLLPPELSARELWASVAATWHPGPDGGSPTPVPPYTPVLAALSAVTLGRESLAVSLLLLGAVPAAGLSAYLAARRLVPRAGLRAWVAVLYAASPVVTGALADGRFDTLVAAVLVPGLLAAGARLLAHDPAAAGWRRGPALGLGLAAACAFAPPLYPLAAVLLLGGAVGVLAGVGTPVAARLRRAAAAVVPLAVVPLLALPWLGRLAADPGVLLTGLGRPAGLAALPAGAAPGPLDLLLLRPATGGFGLPPAWLLAPVLGAALLALLRTDPRRRRLAVALWAVALVGLAGALLASRSRVPGAAGTGWAGPGLALATAAVAGAVAVAAEDLPKRLGRRAFGPRQLAAALAALVVLPVPLLLAGLPALHPADGPAQRRDVALLPPDVLLDAAADPSQRVLVLAQDGDGTLRYDLRGAAGPRLGEEELVAVPAARRLLDAVVPDLAVARGSDAAEVLSTYDVRVVAVVGTGRTQLTDALDAQPALRRRPTGAAGVGIWSVAVPAGRAQVLPPALAAAAVAPAPPAAGTGRGPARAALAETPPLELPAGHEAVTADLPPGPPGRLLVLADAADPGWRARLDGRPLAGRTAWGWAQAFALPPAGGRLVVDRDAGRRHALLAAQAGALALVLLLAAPAVGRDARRPGRSRW